MLLYLVLTLTATIGLISGDSISPEQDEVSGREGDSVKLRCSYDTDDENIDLNWYRHLSNQAPQFILWKGARSRSSDQYIPDNRYQSTTSRTSTELTITNLTLADTALYYCALERYLLTWIGEIDIFGKAITVTVQPKDTSQLNPTLSILRPVDWESDQEAPQACLAAGFRPKGSQMVLQGNNERLSDLSTSKAVLDPKSNSYYYAGFSIGNITSCELNGIVTEGYDGEKKNTITPSPPAVSLNCSNEPAPISFDSVQPENTKFTSSLLVVYGLRVLFTKALVFNVIFTATVLLF